MSFYIEDALRDLLGEPQLEVARPGQEDYVLN
jgi:hypothetical protein